MSVEPSNLPTTCDKISRATLSAMLPYGTVVTLIYNSYFGNTNQHRRVVRATTRKLTFAIVGGVRDGQVSEHLFSKGTEVYRHDEGFTIVWEGKKLAYLFGHRTPQDRPDNTGKSAPTA